MRPILDLPIWVFAPALVLALMALHELGVLLRRTVARYRASRGLPAHEDLGIEYFRAALALMSLMIAFTFGTALERYNTRRTLMEHEALAISSYYREVLGLKEPQRTRLAGGLLNYLDGREAPVEVGAGKGFHPYMAPSEVAARRLWLGLLSEARQDNAGAPETLRRADEILNAAAARQNAMEARVPVAIICGMLLYAFISALFMGYVSKSGQRLLGAPAIHNVMLALALSLVLELDAARTGVIRVDKAPLTEVVTAIHQFEDTRRNAPPEPWLAPTQ